MTSTIIWVLGILISIILSLVGYFFKENISALKALKRAVEDMMIKFAVHEESNKATLKIIDNHDERIADLEKNQVELKLKVNSNQTILKQLKDGTYN